MRMNGRHASRAAMLLAMVVVLAGCGPTSATASPTSAPIATPTATTAAIDTALPSPSPNTSDLAGDAAATGDPGDEPAVIETPAIGFTPGPSGPPAPGTSAGAITRLAGEPDPALTPGSLNPNVTQANIATTICKSGWTDTIRPPVSYTNGLKVTQITQYGYADKSPASYEEDHLISLELGGNPTDPANLWPEPYELKLGDGRSVGAHTKDAYETKLKHEVCAGTITLAQAQSMIGDHWVHFLYGIP